MAECHPDTDADASRTLKYPPADHGFCAHGYITGCSACEAAGVAKVDPEALHQPAPVAADGAGQGWDADDLAELRRMIPDLDAVLTWNPVTAVYFRAGLLACRETMARFVEQGGTDQEKRIAQSIRANWWPSLGADPGPPRKLRYDEVADEKPGGRIDHKPMDPSVEALPRALAFIQSGAHAGEGVSVLADDAGADGAGETIVLGLVDHVNDLSARLAASEAARAAAEEALKWYADKGNYNDGIPTGQQPIIWDNGARARAALAAPAGGAAGRDAKEGPA